MGEQTESLCLVCTLSTCSVRANGGLLTSSVIYKKKKCNTQQVTDFTSVYDHPQAQTIRHESWIDAVTVVTPLNRRTCCHSKQNRGLGPPVLIMSLALDACWRSTLLNLKLFSHNRSHQRIGFEGREWAAATLTSGEWLKSLVTCIWYLQSILVTKTANMQLHPTPPLNTTTTTKCRLVAQHTHPITELYNQGGTSHFLLHGR